MLALNNVNEALQVFNFVIAENPNHGSANTNLGYIYMQQGNNSMSYDYLRKAQQIDPDYEQNLINLAVWFHNNQRPDEARKALEHLLKKHPTNDQAQAMLNDLNK